MRARQFVATCVRVAGIVLGVFTIRSALPYFGAWWDRGAIVATDVLGLTALAMSAGAAVAMVLAPDLVARTISAGDVGDEPVSWSAVELQSALFAVLGVWLVAAAVTDGTYYAALVLLIENEASRVPYARVTHETVAGIVSCVVQLMLGMLLLVRSDLVIRLVRRLRSL